MWTASFTLTSMPSKDFLPGTSSLFSTNNLDREWSEWNALSAWNELWNGLTPRETPILLGGWKRSWL